MDEQINWKREDLYSRQTDIFNPLEIKTRVTIIGAGGIGSPVGLALGKLGIPEINIIDNDTVEQHNLPNQMYPMETIGLPKVEALRDTIVSFSDAHVTTKHETWDGEPLKGIVISAVDSMAVRRKIFGAITLNPAVSLFIDGRIGGESLRVYSIKPCDPDDISFYESMLYSDEEAAELPCTARAVIYVGFFIAALIARAVAKWVKDKERIREVILDAKTLMLISGEGA